MATYEDDLAISEVCRMCLSDLSFEYYTIEGELMSLVSKLVFQVSFYFLDCLSSIYLL